MQQGRWVPAVQEELAQGVGAAQPVCLVLLHNFERPEGKVEGVEGLEEQT